MDTQLPQDFLKLLQPQNRARSTSRGVELLDDQGRWIPIDQTSEQVSEQVVRSRRTRGRAQAATVRIAMAVLVFYGTDEGSSDLGTRIEWYVLVEGVPYLLISQTAVDTTNIDGLFGYVDEDGRSFTLNPPYLSATRDGTVYADFRNYEIALSSYGGDYVGIPADGQDNARHNYHFQIKGGVVSTPDQSPSWRGEWVNTLLPRRANVLATLDRDPNACLDFYRRTTDTAGGSHVNIYDGNLWDAPQLYNDILFNSPNQGFLFDDDRLNYLKDNSVSSTVTIAKVAADGDTCLTRNNQTQTERRKFSTPRIQWDIPSATTIKIYSDVAY